eukprot:3132296-Prymnesium_polylepis.1
MRGLVVTYTDARGHMRATWPALFVKFRFRLQVQGSGACRIIHLVALGWRTLGNATACMTACARQHLNRIERINRIHATHARSLPHGMPSTVLW